MALTPALARQTAEQIVTSLGVTNQGRQVAVAHWTKIVDIIYQSIVQNTVVLPTALLAPPGAQGGLVTGVGTVK